MNNHSKGKIKRKLAEEARLILIEKGTEAYKIAKGIMLSEKIKSQTIREALRHHMQEWQEIQHPGLLSISCEAVGGDPCRVNEIGATLLLLLGSAHVHDDLIDQSKSKSGRPTIYGKFGRDIAILVGDALLFEGLTRLHQYCEKLSEHEKKTVIDLTKSAFFEIGSGEAREIMIKKRQGSSPEETLDYLKMRATMAEAVMRIGAILGSGNEKEIEVLGHYGGTLGFLSAMREEFIDIFEPEELKNRYKHECLPLPLLYGLQNTKKKKEIINLITRKKITEKDVYKLVDLVMDLKDVQGLKKKMKSLIDKEIRRLNVIGQDREALKLLLNSTIEDL